MLTRGHRFFARGVLTRGRRLFACGVLSHSRRLLACDLQLLISGHPGGLPDGFRRRIRDLGLHDAMCPFPTHAAKVRLRVMRMVVPLPISESITAIFPW